MASRKEKINYYRALSRRLRCKQLREYDSLRFTRKPRPTIFTCLLVSIGLVFIYSIVPTEIEVVRSLDLMGPLEPTENYTIITEAFKEETNKTDLKRHLTLIAFNNMTFILNLTQDFLSILKNISKQNLIEPIVIQNLDNANFTRISEEVAKSYIAIESKKKGKKRRRKSTLALNYVSVTEPANPHRIRKVKQNKINIASTFHIHTVFNRPLENNSSSKRV